MKKPNNELTTTLAGDIANFVSPFLSMDKIKQIVDFQTIAFPDALHEMLINMSDDDMNNVLNALAQVYGRKLVYLTGRYLEQERPGIQFKVQATVASVSQQLLRKMEQVLMIIVRAHLKIPLNHEGRQKQVDAGLVGTQLRTLVESVTDNESSELLRTLWYNSRKQLYEPIALSFGAFWTVISSRVLGLRSTQNMEHDVLLALSRLSNRIAFTQANSKYIGLSNGDLDLATFDIVKPSSTHFLTYRLPISPNVANTKVTPTWHRFMDSQWQDDKETTQFLLQWSALHLLPKNVGVFCIMYNTGQGGKSTWMKAIRAMLGGENVASVTADKFSNNFGPSMLLRPDDGTLKLCNLVDESPKDFDMAFLKQVADEGANLTIDIKNSKAVTLPLNIKMTFATNSLEIGQAALEQNFGTYRKTRLLHFPNIISDPDPTMGQKMIEELDDMGGVFLDCLKQMQKQGSFVPIESESMQKWKEDWFASMNKQDTNIVAKFIEERIVFNGSTTITRKLISAAFDEYLTITEAAATKYSKPQVFFPKFEEIVGRKGIGKARKSNGKRLYDGISVTFGQSQEG
ncbi:DUF5906 domain-containing protein [Weissella viridescens]|uniref:DUF5906 domain-containing protein n=1 Tax=Weissella viridescens TaxID=1629 RepID=UPI003AF246CE